MSFSDAAETAIMALIFNATAWANFADNAASAPLTQLAVGLHASDPGETGTMATNEIAYPGYARQNINRNSGGWAVTGGSVSPVADIVFPTPSSGSGTAPFMSIGKTGGGAAAITLSGTLTPPIVITATVVPKISAATTIVLD
jgi:hypothetical protein